MGGAGKFATVEDRRRDLTKSHSIRPRHSGLQHSQGHLSQELNPKLLVGDHDDGGQVFDDSLTSLDQSVVAVPTGVEDGHQGGARESTGASEYHRSPSMQTVEEQSGLPNMSDPPPTSPLAAKEGRNGATQKEETYRVDTCSQKEQRQLSPSADRSLSRSSRRRKNGVEVKALERRRTTTLAQKKALWNVRNKPFYILLPHSSFRSVWDFYIGILLLYVGAFIPYRLSYLGELKGFMKSLEIFVDISFGIDIILNFVTAYETADGRLEVRMKKIAERYVKGYFFLDLIATFPFEWAIRTMQAQQVSGVNHVSKLSKMPKLFKIIKMTRFLKILRVYRLTRFIREVEINYNIHQGVSRLINIVVVILFATHLVGCLWHAIGVELDVDKAIESCLNQGDEESLQDGWICREGLSERSLWHKYVASLYWAFSTLTTVGYGDIAARTVGEQGFSMIMMLLGVSWYAYVVGSMSAIIASFDRQNKQIRLKMLQVNTFIREAKLPPALGHRVRRYYEYLLSKRKNGLFGYDADEILMELSTSLRTDIILHVEADLIKKIPFFEGKCPTFVANAIQVFQPVVVQSGDFIIKEGSAADEMFFLAKGSAKVYYGKKEVATLTEGSYFGEIGCILGGIRRAGIKAETLCELQCLSKRNLNQLLGQHPEVGEDLRRVAKSRMKEVKKEKREKRKQSLAVNIPKQAPKLEDPPPVLPLDTVKEESMNRNPKSVAERNLDKLDQVDFEKLEDENEVFSDLKSDIKSMARKCSAPSGTLPGGINLKPNETTRVQHGTNTHHECGGDAETARKYSLTSGALAGGSHLKPSEDAIAVLHGTIANHHDGGDSKTGLANCDHSTPTGESPKRKTAAEVMASMSPSEQQVIRDFILQEVFRLLEKNLTNLADRLIASNERIMQKTREKFRRAMRVGPTCQVQGAKKTAETAK